MKFIENIEEAQNKVIIRSHGVTKDTYKKAKELNIEVIDLTCPKVLKIHNIAQDYSKEDYYIFIIGKATHPEMIGTISFCGDYYSVIENEDEIENAIDQFKKSNKDKILIISQTTYSLETFENIVKKIKQIIPENKIEIKYDKKWTTEAIFNIVENAVKYSPNNSEISINIEKYEMFARIDIKDSGVGIPEEEIPKIFRRFYRGINVLNEEGIGIGLYLSREIITKQNGYIKVSSSQKGSIFSIFLPNE